MHGFFDFGKALLSMANAFDRAGELEGLCDVPAPLFDTGDRVWWATDPAQDPNLCDRGIVNAWCCVPLEDSYQWSRQYCITVDIDSPSGDQMYYAVVWEHDLLDSAPDYFSAAPAQHLKN